MQWTESIVNQRDDPTIHRAIIKVTETRIWKETTIRGSDSTTKLSVKICAKNLARGGVTNSQAIGHHNSLSKSAVGVVKGPPTHPLPHTSRRSKVAAAIDNVLWRRARTRAACHCNPRIGCACLSWGRICAQGSSLRRDSFNKDIMQAR